MSDLRTAAQQALKALEMSRRFVYADNRPQCDDAIDALRAALAQQQAGSWQDGVLEGHLRERERWLAQQDESETCTWHQDGDSDSGTYSTSCGHYFRLEDGTPEDNKMQWCCYCGKQLAQELITEDDDE